MDITKFGPVERVLVVTGLLALVSSFLPWFTVSFKASSSLLPDVSISGAQSTNGWTTGIGSWGPILLLVALAARAAMPAFGVLKPSESYRLYLVISVLAVVIILIRWATYPSTPAADAQYISMGAGFGTYLGFIAAAGATVAAFFGFRGRKSIDRSADSGS
jgi:hypothetical protein